MITAQLTKKFRFEASHILPLHPGKCSRLHGHSWTLDVTVEGPINPTTGLVVDYADLSRLVNKEIIDRLDHQHLGQGFAYCHEIAQSPPFGTNFYPSSENIAVAIGKMLVPLIPELPSAKEVRLVSITIGETCTSECTWLAPPRED